MSVRGSKNKIILYIAGICSVVFIILLYRDASQRYQEMKQSYERCHLNEESLSAQLQVNLEYKVRLEKSLQQEKSEHSRVKSELQSKLDEEKQTREKENVEAINKFSALQQQYKFLKSQNEDFNLESRKLKQAHAADIDEKSRLENLVQRLKDELNLVKENKISEIEQLKVKYAELAKENALLKYSKNVSLTELQKHDSVKSQVKLPDTLPLNASILKKDEPSPQAEPASKIDGPFFLRSSTSPKKVEQELFLSGKNVYANTSTPMINPDAVSSQDKILSAGPVPQPQRDNSLFLGDEVKENVGAKPDGMIKENGNDNGPIPQGVLHAPDIVKDFDHVPAIKLYKEKFKQEMEKANNAKEINDEGEPLVRNENAFNENAHWRDEKNGEVLIGHHAVNEIPKNPVYHYQGDYDNRKEEGEDDDDVDPMDYHNEKNQQQRLQQQVQLLPFQHPQENFQHRNPQRSFQDGLNGGIHFKLPFQEKRESVMIQPK